MDPNETLSALLAKASELRGILDRPGAIGEELVDEGALELSGQVAELLQALDGWIVMGGHLPDRWEQNR